MNFILYFMVDQLTLVTVINYATKVIGNKPPAMNLQFNSKLPSLLTAACKRHQNKATCFDGESFG